MSMQDPIADMLTRVRNAQAMNKVTVSMPHSTLKHAIAEVLQDEGYIKGFNISGEGAEKTLTVDLKYHQGKPAIDVLKRVSKPSMRVYRSASDLPSVLGGLGIAIVSTSRGVMSGQAAKKLGIGGEVLCFVE
jgi:small subunit ribosomal protein S8